MYFYIFFFLIASTKVNSTKNELNNQINVSYNSLFTKNNRQASFDSDLKSLEQDYQKNPSGTETLINQGYFDWLISNLFYDENDTISIKYPDGFSWDLMHILQSNAPRLKSRSLPNLGKNYELNHSHDQKATNLIIKGQTTELRNKIWEKANTHFKHIRKKANLNHVKSVLRELKSEISGLDAQLQQIAKPIIDTIDPVENNSNHRYENLKKIFFKKMFYYFLKYLTIVSIIVENTDLNYSEFQDYNKAEATFKLAAKISELESKYVFARKEYKNAIKLENTNEKHFFTNFIHELCIESSYKKFIYFIFCKDCRDDLIKVFLP